MTITPGSHAAIPSEMTAMRLHRYGGPEVFQADTVPMPSYGPRDVLVRVRMLAVNGWDARVRQGRAPQLPGRKPIELPIQAGREMVGDVVATGDQVHMLAVGDRVVLSAGPSCNDCSFCFSGRGNLCVRTDYPGHARPGTYAQYAVMPEAWLFKAPPTLSDEELVSIPWAYGNSLHAVEVGGVTLGSTVAVTAASSAMGIASMQLAKLKGAKTVIALSRSPGKAADLLAAGADHVVDYTASDGIDQIKAIAGAPPFGGVDVVLDNYGGQEMMDLAVAIAAFQARIVMVAWQGEAWDGTVAIPGLISLGKELSVITSRGSVYKEQKLVVDLAGAGKLRMPIQDIFALEDMSSAHALLDSGRHTGKILVRA
jgi:NADPH:quinone reductase-like Zn-dependent oxidoreductase